MSNNNYNGIWVFAEQRNGLLHEVAFELMTKARELADQSSWSVTGVLVGQEVAHLSQMLINHGADSVLVAEDPLLALYRLLPYTRVFEQLIKEYRPEAILIGATSMGCEIAPRVAARIGTGLSSHCIDLQFNSEGNLLQIVPGWEPGAFAAILCPDHRPQMATVKPGAMKAFMGAERRGEIREVKTDLDEDKMGPEVLEIVIEDPEELPLRQAEVVVAGGWGIGSLENWDLIEDLARVLGGAVGATRPAVDEGWAEEWQMIGQSGETVRPNLYIGVGISGLMHHVVGMEQSDHVIAINTDPDADIFNVSDLIVVEDFQKIVPLLIEEIRSRTKKQK